MPAAAAPAPARPTLRTLAAAAGVSAMTVSLALRHHPRIPAATRQRVQAAAEKLGYRPDPEVAKLMHHLRRRRTAAVRSALAAVTPVPEAEELPYLREIRRSAQRRAEELGFGLTVFRVEDGAGPRAELARVLRSRGIEGVIMLPVRRPGDFGALLPWAELAVVGTTHAVLAPTFHRVVPHQFANARRICAQLAERGYRRIGLVLTAEHDLRVNHGFSAAVAWQSIVGGGEMVRPLLHGGALPERAELAEWHRREQPDAIIAAGDKDCRLIARLLGLPVPGRIAFASANKAERSVFAGIEEQPAEIGAAAVEELAGMLQRGERGIPAVPKVTMIEGRWVEGRSVRARRRRALKGER